MRSYVERQPHDVLALEREHHHDREQKRNQRQRAYARDEVVVVPLTTAWRGPVPFE